MTFQEAKRKARFGHRPWMAWRDRGGTHHVERMTVANIKRALLDVGTGGHWTMLAASTGVSFRYDWRAGILMRRNARHLGIPA